MLLLRTVRQGALRSSRRSRRTSRCVPAPTQAIVEHNADYLPRDPTRSGHSDEFSFVLKRDTGLYQRRAR